MVDPVIPTQHQPGIPAPDAPTRCSLSGVRLAVAGGGTGGHIVPGLHLIDSLVDREAQPESLLWLHAGRAAEREVLAGLEERCGGSPVRRLPLPLEPDRGGAPALGGLALRLPGAVRRARAALRDEGVHVLLGLGGYTTVPAVLAARSLGIPIALLEINAAAGRATRTLAPLVRRVYHAWPGTLPRRSSDRHQLVGPPVAPSFGPCEEEDLRAARRRLGFAPERPLVVVLGGSQGAKALNRFVVQNVTHLLASGVGVLHQAGPGRAKEGAGVIDGYRCEEYLRDVPTVLSAATLVVCRGGASTLAEIAATRTPAWVVPYPHHADRHQERNAHSLGAGVRIVPEEELGAGFAQELAHLAGSAGEFKRAAMALALSHVSPERAADLLAEGLRELAFGS
ncbi:MAG: glycosyltransferase [Planctomycetota bacterium]|nr:glycosyltransferase [Planctomycetota bacterium]